MSLAIASSAALCSISTISVNIVFNLVETSLKNISICSTLLTDIFIISSLTETLSTGFKFKALRCLVHKYSKCFFTSFSHIFLYTLPSVAKGPDPNPSCRQFGGRLPTRERDAASLQRSLAILMRSLLNLQNAVCFSLSLE